MPFIEAPTTFYMGRRYDPESNRLVDEVVYYDSRDLTTHAVVVGMTGSGKTGMCMALLEEAILDNIPAIVIDPKGDITNLLLTFPELRSQDFAPWVNPSDAQRAGMELNEFAEDVAQQWRDGLSLWSIVPQRIAALKNAAQFSIYTPGSDAGLPVSILDSLQAPREGWAGQEEFHREQISGIVRALMALVGKNVDTVDREHVLISNIFEEAWKNGKSLTLEDIILQVQNPPFARLGVMDVNTFFPEKDRFKLAKALNNIIAAPSFQSWINGEPLDMRRMLYQPNGRPRVSIFYLAHLSEAERTFIITLILENMLAWMRSLSGTTSLRAILYFDEVFGHFPPAPRNPPTKEPLMRLLKQARAFGIGTVLATQNPGDLDYKGLSNAGTWFIGKLQTDNDKKRVLTGLQSAATVNTQIDLGDLDKLISNIAPRVFLVHNVHDEGGPVLLHSRWTMSYLRGPLTRQQIRSLMEKQRQALGLGSAPLAPASGAVETPQVTAPTPNIPDDALPKMPVIKPQTPAAPISSKPKSATTPTPPRILPDEAPRASTPTPPTLPDEAPRGATPPPKTLPDEAPRGTKAAAPVVRPTVPPVVPPTTTQATGSFLDRLKHEAPQEPAEPEEPFRPSQPFQFTPASTPASVPPASTPTPPASGTNTFWLTQPAEPLYTPTPSAPAGDSTAPLGMGYTPANQQGTPTQAGPDLPEGYAERPPALSSSVAQFYLPTQVNTQQAVRQWEQKFNFTASRFGGAQLLYRPVLLAQLGVRYLDKKSNLETEQHWAFQVPNVDIAGFVRWGESQVAPIEINQLASEPYGAAAYGHPSAGLVDAKRMKTLRDEVVDYVTRTASLTIPFNSTLKVYGKPGEEQRDYMTRVQQLARESRDGEIDTVTAKYDKQLEVLEQKLRREMRQTTSDKETLDELKREDLYTTGEAVMSLLKGRTTYTLSRMSRARRYKKQAQERAVTGQQEVMALEEEIEAKQNELQAALQAVNDKWAKIAGTVEEYKIQPFKKDIALEIFGIGWIPQWYVVLNGQPVILPAFAVSQS